MPQKINDVMTRDPVTLPLNSSVTEVARCMKDRDVGAVVVTKDGTACGIVTDRDIVVRAVADNADLSGVQLASVSSGHVASVSPDDSVESTLRLMREQSLRRVLVAQKGKPVGIVSIGDLALERDPDSALADISGAPANK